MRAVLFHGPGDLRLDEVPRIPEEEPGDPIWYPLQHYFGFTAFGINVYTAPEAGGALIAEHDEAESVQEELYLVTEGAARFTIDDIQNVFLRCVENLLRGIQAQAAIVDGISLEHGFEEIVSLAGGVISLVDRRIRGWSVTLAADQNAG